ncbi:hypothetical protein [Mucisphaera sp.]|uniref:hypothetical protein n=1 Tax=Mucisphaera sp. TaxID=2913024 RepID=UPI003D10DD8B
MLLLWLILVFTVALVTFTGGVFLGFHPLHGWHQGMRPAARALSVALFVAFGLNFAACWVASQTVRAYWRTQAELVSRVLPEVETYARNNPGEVIPARWVGGGMEPMFDGGITERPYTYVEVKNFRGSSNDYQWVAYTPEPFYQPAWSLWRPLGDRTRLVLLASGRLLWITEEQFQSLRPDIATPRGEPVAQAVQ